VENEETLQSGTLVGKLSNAIQHQVDNFLSNCVVATSIVVGGVLLTGNQLLGMEKLTVSSSSDFVCEEKSLDECLVLFSVILNVEKHLRNLGHFPLRA